MPIDLFPGELVVDNFAGGGGASQGIVDAIGRPVDIAINHDPEAIAMHKINHPETTHVCGSVWDVKPKALCGGRPVGLAWFSPDCTFFSKSRGGKPFRDRKSARGRRGLAWVAVRWAKEVRPRIICIENVEEFKDWGPLDDTGRPCPKRRGLSFKRWLGSLRNAGYEVEWRELRACDYGAPTIRKRLFIVARCDGERIQWPAPSHGPRGRRPYRTAAECIDWSLPCPSIFERKKPLAEKTLARIARGIRRFVLDTADPFIVPVSHGRTNDARPYSMHEPVKTVTGAHRGELALVAPSFVRTDMHKSNASCAYPPDEPLRTVTTGGGHAVVAAALAKYHGGAGANGVRSQPVDEPLRTVDTANRFALLGATLIQTGYGERPGQAPRVPHLEKPLGTVVGDQKHALVSAFLAKHYGGHESSDGGTAASEPVSTVTTRDHHALVAAHMVKLKGTCRDGQDVREPAPTVCAGGTHLAEVRAFLTRFNNNGDGQGAQLPLGTITSKDRFGLAYVRGVAYEIADIGMRMLAPRELFRAQSFEDHYVIDFEIGGKPITKEAQVRMCGNSVPPRVARAIVSANAGYAADVAA